MPMVQKKKKRERVNQKKIVDLQEMKRLLHLFKRNEMVLPKTKKKKFNQPTVKKKNFLRTHNIEITSQSSRNTIIRWNPIPRSCFTWTVSYYICSIPLQHSYTWPQLWIDVMLFIGFRENVLSRVSQVPETIKRIGVNKKNWMYRWCFF